MRDIFLNHGPLIVLLIALSEAVLAVILWRKRAGDKKPLTLCVAILCTGLFYDALIIGIGRFLPAALLPALSRLRYVASGLMIPLLLPICAYSLRWGKTKLTIVWILTALFMAAGLAEAFAEKLELAEFAGLLRYVSADTTPRWAKMISRISSFGTVIPLILAGLVIAIKQKKPFVLLAGLLMFAFSAIAPATGNMDLIFMMSMIGELLMVLFLLLHIRSVNAGKAPADS